MVSIDEVEAYQPDAQVTIEREQWRAVYIARLWHRIKEESNPLREEVERE